MAGASSSRPRGAGALRGALLKVRRPDESADGVLTGASLCLSCSVHYFARQGQARHSRGGSGPHGQRESPEKPESYQVTYGTLIRQARERVWAVGTRISSPEEPFSGPPVTPRCCACQEVARPVGSCWVNVGRDDLTGLQKRPAHPLVLAAPRAL